MSGTRFNVRLFNMRGIDLDAKDACGTSDPFVKYNFDNVRAAMARNAHALAHTKACETVQDGNDLRHRQEL